MEDDGKDPQALRTRPDVYAWHREYTEAFYILSGQRSYNDSGMSAPISISDIEAYVKLKGVPDTIDRFITCIVSMDRVFISLAVARVSNKAEDLG